MAIIVDVSRYITEFDLRNIKEYLRAMVMKMHFKPEKTFRVAVVEFGAMARVKTTLLEGSSKQQVLAGVASIRLVLRWSSCILTMWSEVERKAV